MGELKKALREKNMLEKQGHIPTIKAELGKWDNDTMLYSSFFWEDIGIKIGWDALTAALAYFAYIKNKDVRDLVDEELADLHYDNSQPRYETEYYMKNDAKIEALDAVIRGIDEL